MSQGNPFCSLLKTVNVNGEDLQYYDLPQLNDPRYDQLPFSIRVLLESAVRSCDGFHVTQADIEKILDWKVQQHNKVEVPFRPSRVLLQDLTGVAAVVDFAAMRDAFKKLGGDPNVINPLCESKQRFWMNWTTLNRRLQTSRQIVHQEDAVHFSVSYFLSVDILQIT